MSKKPIAYEPTLADLATLAEMAQASAKRSIAVLDETTRQVNVSNARIARMEAAANIKRRATEQPAISTGPVMLSPDADSAGHDEADA
jgi:hypothetical protein